MTLNISRVRALCFDVDGTLSDTDDLYARRITHALPRWIFRDPDHAARRFVMWIESPANGLLGLPDRLDLDLKMDSAFNWLFRHRRPAQSAFLLVPGVDKMLEALHGRFPMSVVSARPQVSTLAFLDHFNLTRHFDVIVTSLTAPHTKPYPDPVLYAAQKMGVPPESCLMIGDTSVDIRAGKSAGAQTVGVLCGFGEEAELNKRGADLILHSTAEVGGLFNRELI